MGRFNRKIHGEIWDKKSRIHGTTPDEIFKKRPDYKDKDVIVVDYEDSPPEVLSVNELKAAHPETKNMKSSEVKDWYVKRRKAILSQYTEAIWFREVGYMQAMAEMMTKIVELEQRIKQLENK